MENTRACKRDNNIVYIAGNETGYLVIVKSNNRGITWQTPIEHTNLASYQVRALGCVPRSEGDILLLQGWRTNYEFAIFRSENGGLTWSKVFYIPTRQSWMPHMYFYRTSWGEVFTSFLVDGDLKIMSSSDNGLNWRVRYVGYPASISVDSHMTFSMAEGDNYRLVANSIQTASNNSESGWQILTSPDGGDTWTGIPFPSSGYSTSVTGTSNVRLANGTLVSITGVTYTQASRVLISQNNGVSWSNNSLNIQVISSIVTQNTIICCTTSNSIIRITSLSPITYTTVATTQYPIYDFIGFEA